MTHYWWSINNFGTCHIVVFFFCLGTPFSHMEKRISVFRFWLNLAKYTHTLPRKDQNKYPYHKFDSSSVTFWLKIHLIITHFDNFKLFKKNNFNKNYDLAIEIEKDLSTKIKFSKFNLNLTKNFIIESNHDHHHKTRLELFGKYWKRFFFKFIFS